jgi:hypothetical protein
VTLPVSTEDSGSTGAATVRQRGWELAHWAVANSSVLHIDRVSYAGREWTAESTDSSWRTSDANGGSAAETSTAEVRIVTGQ